MKTFNDFIKESAADVIRNLQTVSLASRAASLPDALKKHGKKSLRVAGGIGLATGGVKGGVEYALHKQHKKRLDRRKKMTKDQKRKDNIRNLEKPGSKPKSSVTKGDVARTAIGLGLSGALLGAGLKGRKK